MLPVSSQHLAPAQWQQLQSMASWQGFLVEHCSTGLWAWRVFRAARCTRVETNQAVHGDRACLAYAMAPVLCLTVNLQPESQVGCHALHQIFPCMLKAGRAKMMQLQPPHKDNDWSCSLSLQTSEVAVDQCTLCARTHCKTSHPDPTTYCEGTSRCNYAHAVGLSQQDLLCNAHR